MKKLILFIICTTSPLQAVKVDVTNKHSKTVEVKLKYQGWGTTYYTSKQSIQPSKSVTFNTGLDDAIEIKTYVDGTTKTDNITVTGSRSGQYSISVDSRGLRSFGYSS